MVKIDFAEIERNFEGDDKQLELEMIQLKTDTRKIIKQIRAIPYGEVVSYKEVANLAGLVNGARQVARILHSLSQKYQLPWWRVIRADGRIALTGAAKVEQMRLLRSEGLKISETGHVEIKKKK